MEHVPGPSDPPIVEKSCSTVSVHSWGEHPNICLLCCGGCVSHPERTGAPRELLTQSFVKSADTTPRGKRSSSHGLLPTPRKGTLDP